MQNIFLAKKLNIFLFFIFVYAIQSFSYDLDICVTHYDIELQPDFDLNKADIRVKVEVTNFTDSSVDSIDLFLCTVRDAKDFAEKQQNAYLNIFEGVAHSPVDAGPCAIMMMKEFFDNPNQAPDNSCVKEFSHQFKIH